MGQLIVALSVFLGTHFLLSHPLRAPLVKALGATGFQIVYSVVALASFVWAALAFRAAPAEPGLWIAGDLLWWIATVIMLAGSILFAGSLVGNPALPTPLAEADARKPPHGVFAITRHPMMWGFALWSLVHFLASPQPKVIALTSAMALLALAGSAAQDAKKRVLMGSAWADWAARTSYLPFARQLSGAASWRTIWPGRTILLLGTLLWLVASWAHPWLGGAVAGIWRWL